MKAILIVVMSVQGFGTTSQKFEIMPVADESALTRCFSIEKMVKDGLIADGFEPARVMTTCLPVGQFDE